VADTLRARMSEVALAVQALIALPEAALGANQ
jgi:hypothetical protein